MSNYLFAICVGNNDYEVSLEKRKLYKVLRDSDASINGQIRVIDESGRDYLYPRDYFAVVCLPKAVEVKVLDAA
jgi:hypothetical protein